LKRLALLSFATAMAIVMANISNVGLGNQLLACSPSSGVVDKASGAAFAVDIAFKNTGSTEGSWSVNVAFEGEKWSWVGTPQNLTLKPDKARTLVWNGSVPANAPTDSVARLIVYYDDSLTALNWWIHVVPAAELAITSSTVR
jgi:hypothetical protein